ncbi:hypothetical protein GCM10010174_51650 [Kutzneria viridogrisea]
MATPAAVEGGTGRIGPSPVRVRVAPGTVPAPSAVARTETREGVRKEGDHLSLKDTAGRAVRPFATVTTTPRALTPRPANANTAL